MTSSLVEFTHILTTIEDLLFMSESRSHINISTGSDDDEYSVIFMQLAFSLKQGESEIRIYDKTGIISYVDTDRETLRRLEFDYSNISTTYSSFNKALKQILDLDRQRVNKAKSPNYSNRLTGIPSQHSEQINSSLDEIRKILPEAN